MYFKVCAKCKVEKTIEEFHKSKRDGYRSRCKNCKKEDDKIWRANNKKVYLEMNKKWREENKDYMINYYNENKDHIKSYLKEYYLENRDEIILNSKNNYENTCDYKKNKSKERYNLIKNTDEFKEKQRIYQRTNYKKNPHIYAHRNILKRHLKMIESKKNDKTEKILGYTSEDLRKHIELLFKDGMSWDNYGKWHIDHIKPISKFEENEDPSVVNSLDNLQPLWAFENLSKGDKYE